MPQADVTARSLCLRWVPGSDGASPIRYFTVQLRELPGGQWQTYSSSISHEATAYVVERYQERGEGPAPPLGALPARPQPPASSRLPSRETHTASPRLPPGQPSRAGTRESQGPPRPLPACPSELCPSPLPPSPGADRAAQSLRQMAAQPDPGTMSQAQVTVRETTLLHAPAPGQQGTCLPPAAIRGAAVMANSRNRAPRPPSRLSGDCWVGGGPGHALS